MTVALRIERAATKQYAAALGLHTQQHRCARRPRSKQAGVQGGFSHAVRQSVIFAIMEKYASSSFHVCHNQYQWHDHDASSCNWWGGGVTLAQGMRNSSVNGESSLLSDLMVAVAAFTTSLSQDVPYYQSCHRRGHFGSSHDDHCLAG